MSPAEIFQHARDVFAIGAMAVGLVFVIAGATGVMRLPDFYTRMHAAGVTDTLGAELIIVGLIAQAGDWQTATHAIANAAHRAGQKPDLAHFKPKHPADAASSEASK
jgi:multicomponent Na+:H+ antiporter subunit G